MNNNYIRYIFEQPIKWFKYQRLPNQLGRWSRLETEKQMDQRVTMTIEDHCGLCNEYMNQKYEIKIKKKNK